MIIRMNCSVIKFQRRHSLCAGYLLIAMFCCGITGYVQPLWAHTDLENQIEVLTRQLVIKPADTEILIRRGELYRRHGDWVAGEADFESVRAIEPDHPTVDWYQGHLLADAQRNQEGLALLTRFLQANPQHSGAFQVRAMAYFELGDPLSAASDFQSAISTSSRPSPAQYRSLIISLVVAGRQYADRAMQVALSGLEQFPAEINLLGLAVDLTLAQRDARRTEMLIAQVSPAVAELPQWLYRQSLLACVDGNTAVASETFGLLKAAAGTVEKSRTGTWELPESTLEQLSLHPEAETCSGAAWSNLTVQRP